MSGVYENLKARVQDTLQRGKADSAALARVKTGRALSLQAEMAELERMVGERIGKLKAALTEGEAVVAAEAEQTEQLVENLQAGIAGLEAKLAASQESALKNDAARRQTEESLSAKLAALQRDLRSKEEALARRDDELNNLESELDRRTKQIGALELAAEKTRQEGAEQATRAAAIAQSSREKIAALESRLKESEGLVSAGETTIKGLEQKLAATIEEFHGLLKTKEALLTDCDAKINDLTSQLKLLTKGIGEMSSLFRQAEALVGVDGKVVSAAGLDKPANESLESPLTTQSNGTNDTPTVAAAPGEVVSPDFFQRITAELADVTGVMSPLASLVVQDHVAILGESMERFPKKRLPELLESLAKEIADKRRQIDFRLRLAQNAQISLN